MRGASLHLYFCATVSSALAVTAVPALAQDQGSKLPVTPQALSAKPSNCPGAAGDDVVVCGRRNDRRFRIDPNVLATDRLLDEQQRASVADPNAASNDCTVGPHVCAGTDTIPVTAIAVVVAKVVLHAAQGDDWRKDLKTGPDAYETYRDIAEKPGN